MASEDEQLMYLSSGRKIIFLIDPDIQLLKKIGSTIAEKFVDYEVIAMDNLEEAREEMQENRPSVIVTALSFPDGSSSIEFMKDLKNHELTKKIALIAIATRGELEENSDFLERQSVEMVPKAIRIPYLLGVVSSSIQTASAVVYEVKNLEAGDILFQEGDKSEHIYVLNNGHLHVYKDKNGEEFPIADITERQLIGEMAFLDKSLRSASVRAVSNCEVIVLKLGDIDSFIKEQPFWLGMILQTLANRLKDSNRKIMELTSS
jgi:CRP/FNR family transcriptional regulator, cyclic AMP receptor protein